MADRELQEHATGILSKTKCQLTFCYPDFLKLTQVLKELCKTSTVKTNKISPQIKLQKYLCFKIKIIIETTLLVLNLSDVHHSHYFRNLVISKFSPDILFINYNLNDPVIMNRHKNLILLYHLCVTSW